MDLYGFLSLMFTFFRVTWWIMAIDWNSALFIIVMVNRVKWVTFIFHPLIVDNTRTIERMLRTPPLRLNKEHLFFPRDRYFTVDLSSSFRLYHSLLPLAFQFRSHFAFGTQTCTHRSRAFCLYSCPSRNYVCECVFVHLHDKYSYVFKVGKNPSISNRFIRYSDFTF